VISTSFIQRQRRRLLARERRYRELIANAGNVPASNLRLKQEVSLPFIRAALDRIDRGTYGICDECGEEIPRERLVVVPAAIRCAPCQSEREVRRGHA
jgi:DnaK suppressor protein